LQGPYFALDHLELHGTRMLPPGLRMVTATEGTLAVTVGGETATISPWETVLVAGGAGESAVSGVGRALVAGLV
jgi:mannose-6-phosphate isomerase class I